MGGRGASSGKSIRGGKEYPYGSEYRTVYKESNIKFVQSRSGENRTPMETMTSGRVYVTLNKSGNLKAITYYDKENKRTKQIDLDVPHDKTLPHTHHGYEHNERDGEKGYANLTPEEKKMVDRVRRIWYNHHSKL